MATMTDRSEYGEGESAGSVCELEKDTTVTEEGSLPLSRVREKPPCSCEALNY